MSTLPRAMLLALLAIALPALAQVPVPEPAASATPAEPSLASLDGYIVVTPDADWRQQWDAAIDGRPAFRSADSVAPGGVLYVLTFIVNPAPGLGNRANVRCDVQVLRPDGTYSVNQRDVVCYQGIINGDPLHAYLAAPTLTFRGEPTDQRGRWAVRVTLHDRNRSVALPLEAAFTVLD